MPTVVFQVVSNKDFLAKFSDPNFMTRYRHYVLREITEKASEVVRQHANKMWANPTGALADSWFTRIDPITEVGFISNSKPYAYWLNYGVRPHRMRYLLHAENSFFLQSGDKAVVIPLKKDGKRIFRIATSAHMRLPDSAKPWWHKGIEPKHFLEDGMEQYRKEHLQADYEGLTIKILDLGSIP